MTLDVSNSLLSIFSYFCHSIFTKLQIINLFLLHLTPDCYLSKSNFSEILEMEISSWKSFGGTQKIFSHESKVLGCTMKYSVFLPEGKGPFPVMWFLSGLTCTEQNCVQKGAFQEVAAANKMGELFVFIQNLFNFLKKSFLEIMTYFIIKFLL